MPIPTHIFDPPFNIIRSSHAVLDVVDLDKSRAFYETTVGLHVEDRDDKAVYLRGSEEHQHHSLVLRRAPTAACNRLGFKVGTEADLALGNDRAPIVFSVKYIDENMLREVGHLGTDLLALVRLEVDRHALRHRRRPDPRRSSCLYVTTYRFGSSAPATNDNLPILHIW